MGSGQSVPKDSPLACVLKNLKPLSLTELKANRLKQLCTQIWPQYQLDNQDGWTDVSTFDFNILQNLTDFLKQNGKWSEIPYAQAFGPFGAGPPYARPAPPTKSFYAPCLPSKRALLPQLTADRNLLHPQSSTPRTSSLPTRHPAAPLRPLHPTHLLALKPLLTPPRPLPHLPDSSSPFLPALPGQVPSMCFP